MFAFVLWCFLAGLLSLLFARSLRRAPYQGVPDEARRFYDRLVRSLSLRHPGVELIGPTQEGFGAVVRVDRQELAVPLGEVFLREKAFPEAFDDTVSRLVVELREHLAATGDLLFDEAVEAVLPQIRAEDWIRDNSPAFGDGSLVREEIFESLALCFVIDEGDSMVFVTQGHLRSWGIDLPSLKNLALANLRRLAESEGGLPEPSAQESEACVLKSGDGYDAARVLLALDRSVEDVDGLVFAIPDRDTLLVGRKSEGLAQLMAAVDEEYASAEHPISPRVFEVRERRLTAAELVEDS